MTLHRFGSLAATLVARLEAEAAHPPPTRAGVVHRRGAFDALADRVENVGCQFQQRRKERV